MISIVQSAKSISIRRGKIKVTFKRVNSSGSQRWQLDKTTIYGTTEASLHNWQYFYREFEEYAYSKNSNALVECYEAMETDLAKQRV